jgi:hypothetical protein
MNSAVYGIGALNPGSDYPRFPEAHKVDCMPVDFFVSSEVGERLNEVLSTADVFHIDSVERMVGACAAAALMPEIPIVSRCETAANFSIRSDGRIFTQTTFLIASESAVTAMLRQSDMSGSLVCAQLQSKRAVIPS